MSHIPPNTITAFHQTMLENASPLGRKKRNKMLGDSTRKNFHFKQETSTRAAVYPLEYDFEQRGPPITRGCLEPLYEMKSLFVPVMSSQWNCEESANDGGIDFPTHECNEDFGL